MRNLRWLALGTVVLVFVAASSTDLARGADDGAGAGTVTAPQNTAIDPVPRPGAWMQRHERINERAKQGDVDLLFIGDSITQGWETAAPRGGKDVWAKYYGSRKAMNAGISGDRTQHVLWRLENGNIDGIKPKLAVIMIGTNNAPEGRGPSNTAEEIADGIKAIVGRLREKLPETKILLLAIFPRDEKPETATREKIAKASELASQMADDKMIFYMDIGNKFLSEDGTLPKDIMPDSLHPNAKGYEIWADAIEPKVAELLAEKK